MRRLARRWQGCRVVVVGDVLLDRWLIGTPSRLCREAPAPVLDLDRIDEACGGAANTAVNLAALGAVPLLFGAVGDDAAAARLCGLLRARGVQDCLVRVPGRRTVTKSRLVAGDHILARLDDGDTGPVADAVAGRLCQRLALVTGAAAVVICDYGGGTLTAAVRHWLAGARDRLPLVVVDAHEPAAWREVRPALATPAYRELGDLVPPANGRDRAAAVEAAAAQILAVTGAGVAAVTLDEDGAVVLDRDAPPCRTYAVPEPASRTAGAGDAYAAGFTLSLVAGAPVGEAAEVAQRAATLAIQETGTCVCPLDRLLDGAPAQRTEPSSIYPTMRR